MTTVQLPLLFPENLTWSLLPDFFVSLTAEQEALALPKRAMTLDNDALVYTNSPLSVEPPHFSPFSLFVGYPTCSS